MIYELVFILFGFLKAFKPSEAFLTPFLCEVKGLTKNQVKDEVYPVWTYSFFALIIPLTILAEKVGYRVVIYLEVLGHLATRAILIFATGLGWMKTMQFTFGLACAGELVYYAYVFKVFPREKHQMITSFSRAAVLMGHCVGSLLGQLLVQFHLVEYVHLFWISGITVASASIIALWFPPYFREGFGTTYDRLSEYQDEDEQTLLSSDEKLGEIYPDLVEVETSEKSWLNLMQPLLIYALNLTHLYNLEGYTSVFWYKILQDQGKEKDVAKVWNGYADVGARGLGALFAILAWVFLKRFTNPKSLKKSRSAIVAVLLILITLCTGVISYLNNIYASYAVYMIAAGLGGMVSAVTSAWMGEAVVDIPRLQGKVAFVFGLSTFLCAGVQSLMLLILSNIKISIQTQFIAYTCFIAALSVFAIGASINKVF